MSRLLASAMVLAIALAAVGAHAHVVLGTTTVQLRTLQSDLVARVRIVDPAVQLVLQEPELRETVVTARVLEVLKGQYDGKELRFVQRGHGVPAYQAGDEVLLFVDRIARSPELGKSRLVGHVDWVSQQETGAKFALDETTRDDFSAAVRAYAALPELSPTARPDAARRVTLKMLASPHPVLAGSALRDVVLASNSKLFSAADLPALVAILDDPDTTIGVRIGLLAELERRALVEGPPRWAVLLRTTQGAEQLAVVRAVAAHPSDAVAEELTKLLAASDPQLVASAAVSFGSLRSDVAVEPLAALLASSEPRVRMAAIRGLGRVGSPAAKTALAQAAATNPDAATRRRAGAEVKVLARHAAPTTKHSPETTDEAPDPVDHQQPEPALRGE